MVAKSLLQVCEVKWFSYQNVVYS